MNNNIHIIPLKDIQNRIFTIRGVQIMIDSDLAELYGVETRRLNEQVKRNIDRFPENFMFRMTKEETTDMISQNATSSWGGRRKLPYAFTDLGKKWFAFSKMDIRVIEMLKRLNEKNR